MLDWFLCSPGFNGAAVDDVALDCCSEFLCAGVMFWRSGVFSFLFER